MELERSRRVSGFTGLWIGVVVAGFQQEGKLKGRVYVTGLKVWVFGQDQGRWMSKAGSRCLEALGKLSHHFGQLLVESETRHPVEVAERWYKL